MSAKNTSDSIEAYIKSILAQAGMVELKRSELADVFQVVPSQINYVIKTRFTESRGYLVESKRGSVGDRVSQQVFADVIQLLFDEKIITEREGNLILSTASDSILGDGAAVIRARILKKILQQLDRKGMES